MAKNYQAIEQIERDRPNHEQIQRGDAVNDSRQINLLKTSRLTRS
jgi:hypothetical protein